MSLKSPRSRWLVVPLVLLIALIGAMAERMIEAQKSAELRVDVRNRLGQSRERLSGNLYADLQLVRGLVGVINLEPDLTQERFERAAGPILAGRTQLRNIAAAPGMVIRLIVPIQGNQQAIGLDYRALPSQFEAADRARRTRQIVLAGPVPLVQGGRGLIARLPVFLPDAGGGERFWGLVSAVIDSDLLMQRSGLDDADLPIEVAIRGKDATGAGGAVFFGAPHVFDSSPVLADINLPQGSWQIAAIPRGGWPQHSPGLWPLRAGFALIGLAVLGLFYAQGRVVRAGALAEERAAWAARQMTSLLEAAPDATLLVDRSGQIAQANARAIALFGWSREQLVGAPIQRLVPAIGAHGSAMAPESIHGSHTRTLETDARRSDGSSFPAEISLAAVHTADGMFIASSVRDITARHQADEELKMHRDRLELLVAQRTHELEVAKDAAEAANVAKGAFLANVSHEIRTPLNAITGMVHLIRRAGLHAEQSARVDTVESASTHLLEVINALLDLSKIDSGKFELASSPIRLDTILENAAEMLRGRAELKGLRLRVELPGDHAPVLGDSTRLQQCLLNYVSNAIKFSDRGEVVLRLIVQQPSERIVHARFEVEDSGVGIDAQTLGRLFQPFEQADNTSTRAHGGTGLGLALTRRLALLMGGDTGASSVPGQGSIFWFTAQFERAADGIDTAPALPGRAHGRPAIAFNGESVLLVEDDPVNQLIARALLSDVGLEVSCASDGQQALELLAASRFDIVLMDIQMPRMDGISATRAIRASDRHAAMPVIALTANAFEEDRRRCLDAGMTDFLAKPFDPQELYALLARWLQRYPPRVRDPAAVPTSEA